MMHNSMLSSKARDTQDETQKLRPLRPAQRKAGIEIPSTINNEVDEEDKQEDALNQMTVSLNGLDGPNVPLNQQTQPRAVLEREAVFTKIEDNKLTCVTKIDPNSKGPRSIKTRSKVECGLFCASQFPGCTGFRYEASTSVCSAIIAMDLTFQGCTPGQGELYSSRSRAETPGSTAHNIRPPGSKTPHIKVLQRRGDRVPARG